MKICKSPSSHHWEVNQVDSGRDKTEDRKRVGPQYNGMEYQAEQLLYGRSTYLQYIGQQFIF